MFEGHVVVTRKIPEPGLDLLRSAGVALSVLEEEEDQGPSHQDLFSILPECDVLLPLLTKTTADLAWALLMATACRIPEAHHYQVAGRYRLWGPNLFTGMDVSPGASGHRKILGIVGYGRIGQALAKRSHGFHMEVLAHDPYNREGIDADARAIWADLPELLERNDFVTLHTLLTEETHHLIGEAEFRRMKSTAVLINTASASRDTRARMAEMAAANTLAFLRGERGPTTVNPQVYETEAYRARTARVRGA